MAWHSALAVEVSGLVKTFGELHGGRRGRPGRGPRHGPRPARAQRRRQDHDHPSPGHPAAASTPAPHGARARRGRRGRRRPRPGRSDRPVRLSTKASPAGRTWYWAVRLLGLPHRQARTRAGELLDAFGLAEAAGRQVTTYSGGMRRRLDIAASLILPPQLLFLDEPTTGLTLAAAPRSGSWSGRWPPAGPRCC